jgi:hypothetical protein
MYTKSIRKPRDYFSMSDLTLEQVNTRKKLYRDNRAAIGVSMSEMDRLLHMGLPRESRVGFSSRREAKAGDKSSRTPTYSDLAAQQFLILLKDQGFNVTTIVFEAGQYVLEGPLAMDAPEDELLKRKKKKVMKAKSKENIAAITEANEKANELLKAAELEASKLDVSHECIRRARNEKDAKAIIAKAKKEGKLLISNAEKL